MVRGSIIGLVVACSACATLERNSWSASEDESVYARRFDSVFVRRTAEFSPQEPVRGAVPAFPLRRARTAVVADQALDAARTYAAANNSSAFLVWRDGALEEESYFGSANAQTLMLSRSLAKPLTAIVIGRAIARGDILSLDQPVADFITEWRDGPQADILIRHLLDMRTGLLAQSFSNDPNSILNRAYLHPRHDRILIDEYPLTDPPGRSFAYSNANSELVAIVIERATGMRYARFVSEQVLAPIGAAGGEVWINRPGGLAHSGCCISLPAQTWLRLAILLLDDGRWDGRAVLPEGFVAEMRRPTPGNPYYGMGVYLPGPFTARRGFSGPSGGGPLILHSEPYLTDDLFLFDGNASQVVYIVPGERLVVMRLGDAPPQQPEWDNSVLLNTILRGLAPPAGGRALQQ